MRYQLICSDIVVPARSLGFAIALSVATGYDRWARKRPPRAVNSGGLTPEVSPMHEQSTTSPAERTCTICRKTFPATPEHFNRCKALPSGLSNWCRICAAERRCQRKHGGIGRRIESHPNIDRAERDLLTLRLANKAMHARLRHGGHLTATDIRDHYAAQEGRCFWCGTHLGVDFAVDHAVPISRGGRNTTGNILITCHHCNKAKQTKMPHEFVAALVSSRIVLPAADGDQETRG
jgi:hypothetical protein